MADIVINRMFEAPRAAVFSAWTDPDQVAEWWGPDGFEAPRDEVDIDLREGGRYDLCMVDSRDGRRLPLRQMIVEVDEPALLVLRADADPEIGLPEDVITRVELHEEDGRTRMTLTFGPYTDEMKRHAEAGWRQSLDRLDARLASRV